MTDASFTILLDFAAGGLTLAAVLIVWRRDLRAIVRLLAWQGLALAAIPIVRGLHDGVDPERPADPSAPFAALAFKVSATPTGRLTFLRVYSGTIEKGDTVFDATARRTERIGRILRVRADRHAQLDRAVAGDIVAVIGLKSARPGAHPADLPAHSMTGTEVVTPAPQKG